MAAYEYMQVDKDDTAGGQRRYGRPAKAVLPGGLLDSFRCSVRMGKEKGCCQAVADQLQGQSKLEAYCQKAAG